MITSHHLQILICTGPSATGSCAHETYELDACHNLTAPYAGDAATFAPDGEDFYCYPYLMACGGICRSPEGCTYGAVSFNTTAKFNLTAAGGWNELIESFECHAGSAPVL